MVPAQLSIDLTAVFYYMVHIEDVQAAFVRDRKRATFTFMAVGCGDDEFFKVIQARTVILHTSHGKGPDIIAIDGSVYHAFDLGLAPKVRRDGHEVWSRNVVCFPLDRSIHWRIMGWLSSLGTDGARYSMRILQGHSVYA